MLGKLQENQREPFRTRLEDLINPNHELALLANKIDWQYFENEFILKRNGLRICKSEIEGLFRNSA